jgi:hypothetical protein
MKRFIPTRLRQMGEILERLDVKRSLLVERLLFLFLKTKGEIKMESELRLMIKVFEDKINKTEEEYKKKNNGQVDRDKMDKYVNRKLKKEIMILNFVNITPSANALNITKRFKY